MILDPRMNLILQRKVGAAQQINVMYQCDYIREYPMLINTETFQGKGP